ncbi:phosphatase and actin regulator 3 isoform X2 [Suncus etruscus]|uniref:phosphatase and actin regulator 3 isoform X2 n=1 Tax=Suncus etruscus TaxID=109475 RepID=UPI00210F70D1|nr:phosphatase and actin regulator 3 isoform X2 [Suncus etruscus]
MRGRSRWGHARWPEPVRSLLRVLGTRNASAATGLAQDEMAETTPTRPEYLVSGTRTPPVRRNKLASLGRIFKPWKWRKKKSEKLKQTTSALEKMSSRQGREELIKKGLLEMMEQETDHKACSADGGPPTPQQEPSSLPEAEPGESVPTGPDQAEPHCPSDTDRDPSAAAAETQEEEAETDSEEPAADISSPALARPDSPDSAPRTLEMSSDQLPSSSLQPTPPPKAGAKAMKLILGQAVPFHSPSGKNTDPALRAQLSTPSGSPHLPTVHCPLPPSRVIEELHRALATKHCQGSFQGRENKGSPKKRADARLSRMPSLEQGKDREQSWSPDGAAESKQESEENKENLLGRPELRDEDLLLYQDPEVLDDSIISGTLPRRCKKELLAVKLRSRPSKQELEERNIFPQRTDEERQEIRQQIELKLSKRLSQRPPVEELERRNILKQRNDQTEQDERREIKQRLTRKLNQRPTVDELRDRKILIRFSDYVEVAKAQDYDRRADKPWTRLSAADKAAIRKELNEYKSNEMEVHASSRHLTRFHRP